MVFEDYYLGSKFLLGFTGILPTKPMNIQDTFLQSEYDPNKKYRTKIYTLKKNNKSNKIILLVHGMSGFGIDDDRIYHLARNLVNLGYIVITPELEEVKKLKIVDETVRNIQDCYSSISKNLFPKGKISFFSVSFSAGMGLVAFSDKNFQSQITSIQIVGSFFNLLDVSPFLVRNFEKDDYGSFILFYNFIAKVYKNSKALTEVFYQSALDNGLARTNTSLAKAPKLISNLNKIDKELYNKIIIDREFRISLADEINLKMDTLARNISPKYFVSNLKSKVSIIHGKNDYVIPETESMYLEKFLNESKIENKFCLTELLSHGDTVSYSDKLNKIPELAKTFGYFFKTLQNAQV